MCRFSLRICMFIFLILKNFYCFHKNFSYTVLALLLGLLILSSTWFTFFLLRDISSNSLILLKTRQGLHFMLCILSYFMVFPFYSLNILHFILNSYPQSCFILVQIFSLLFLTLCIVEELITLIPC